jgi:DNA-binding SARP family transcriptional activator
VALGWPREKIQTDAAANRLRVAIATLRRLGLGELLETRGDGYRLAPTIRIVDLHEGRRASSVRPRRA